MVHGGAAARRNAAAAAAAAAARRWRRRTLETAHVLVHWACVLSIVFNCALNSAVRDLLRQGQWQCATTVKEALDMPATSPMAPSVYSVPAVLMTTAAELVAPASRLGRRLVLAANALGVIALVHVHLVVPVAVAATVSRCVRVDQWVQLAYAYLTLDVTTALAFVL